MELNEYQQQAMTTCTRTSKNDTYMLFGLMAEVGEVADKIAKWRRKSEARIDGDTIVFNTSDADVVREYKEALIAEVGDILWFVSGLSHELGFTLQEVADRNLAKLRSRKERGVIIGNGDNR